MWGRAVVTLLLALVLLAGVSPATASAHAGLTRSDPAAGATLGASPTAVRLTFSEQPEAALSTIRVLGAGGAARQDGSAVRVPGVPLALEVPVRALGHGVYTVTWRAVSAVDGHATTGAFAFGVRASPTGTTVTAPTTASETSGLELAARWILLVGLVALLGAAVSAVARFGGRSGTDLRLAAGGWCVAVAGVVLLGVAQRQTAGSSLPDLLDTPIGHALLWRAVALGATGVALLAAWRRPRIRRLALGLAALGALATILVHVAAGHAAAGTWPRGFTVGAQAVHFGAAGVWFGGLAALLLGVRGAPSAEKAAAVRRFSAVALVMFVVVAATGTLRAIDELSSVGDLVSSGYGRAVLAKILLILVLLGLGAAHRRRSVPVAASDLSPLRRTSRVELGVAAAALAAAALLGTLAPPAPGPPSGPTGLSASGADIATTVRAKLTTASAEPGANRFTFQVEDYDSRALVRGAQVQLRFVPLDDPGVAATVLRLRAARNGGYVGTGANLAFDGRWRVTALVQRARDSVSIPLNLDVRGPRQFVSVLAVPGKPVEYTMPIEGVGALRISPNPERAGPSAVTIEVYDIFGGLIAVSQPVVAVTAGDGPTSQPPVRRLAVGRYVAAARLRSGPVAIAVTTHSADGSRIHGVFDLKIPGD